MPTAPSNKDVFDFARLLDAYVSHKPMAVQAKPSALEAYLYSRIANGPGNDWLDLLPFHVVSQTAENLGILMTLGPDTKRADITDEDWIAAGHAGYRVLAQGPDALRQLLADMKRGYVNDAARYRSRYGFFFEWLRSRDDDPDFDVIRDLVRDFVWKNFPVAKGALVLGKECPQQYVHSISTAVTATGITKRQLGRRLCAMGLAEHGRGTLAFDIYDYIPAAVIENIKTEFSNLFNATQASAYLGIKPFMLTKLTRPDLIEVFVREEKASPLYHSSVLASFMKRLEDLREPGAPGDGWYEIAGAALRAKMTTERALSLIFLHKLPLRCQYRKVAGFSNFFVELATLRDAINLPEEGAVHPTRAAKILGLRVDTVISMLERGHLERVSRIRSAQMRPVFYACPWAVEDFPAMYISLKELKARSAELRDFPVAQDALHGFRLDLGPKAEPIYRKDVLDIL